MPSEDRFTPAALQFYLATKSLLVFDLDGTLADSGPLHARAFQQTLDLYGIHVDFSLVAGMKALDAMSYLWKREKREPSLPLIGELSSTKRGLKVRELQPIAGSLKFLGWALEHFQFALYSAGSRQTALTLARLGVESWFSPCLVADDVSGPSRIRKVIVWLSKSLSLLLIGYWFLRIHGPGSVRLEMPGWKSSTWGRKSSRSFRPSVGVAGWRLWEYPNFVWKSCS